LGRARIPALPRRRVRPRRGVLGFAFEDFSAHEVSTGEEQQDADNLN